MTKQYRIQIRGKQRENVDADLMAQLVVMLGRQLAEDARQAMIAVQEGEAAEAKRQSSESAHDGQTGGRS